MQPTVAALATDPIGADRQLGVYSGVASLHDMPAISVPAGQADGGHFGVTIGSRPFGDQTAFDVARLLVP